MKSAVLLTLFVVFGLTEQTVDKKNSPKKDLVKAQITAFAF